MVSGSLATDERGTVTAEFAIVLPIVVAVLGLVIGAMFLAAHRITLVAGASEISRFEARGDSDGARTRIEQLGDRVTVERSEEGALHCVSLSSRPAGGVLAGISVSARSCAATIGTGDGS